MEWHIYEKGSHVLTDGINEMNGRAKKKEGCNIPSFFIVIFRKEGGAEKCTFEYCTNGTENQYRNPWMYFC